MKSTFENLTKKAIDNIESDRKVTEDLLTDLQSQLNNGDYTHVEVGTIAAKLVETLQRSNEQLVKLATMLSRRTPPSSDFKLNEQERENLFDISCHVKMLKVHIQQVNNYRGYHKNRRVFVLIIVALSYSYKYFFADHE